MATTLYLHSDASAVGGTLPATEQSSGTPGWPPGFEGQPYTYQPNLSEYGSGFDGSSTHLSMDESQGSSEDNYAHLDPYDMQHLMMLLQFISPPLSAGSISADDWVLHMEGARVVDTGESAKMMLSVYLWRPSTGAKITHIYDGSDQDFYGTVLPSNTRAAFSVTGAGSGATAQDGDVIVLEVWTYSFAVGLDSGAWDLYYDTGTVGRVVAPDLPLGGGGPPQQTARTGGVIRVGP